MFSLLKLKLFQSFAQTTFYALSNETKQSWLDVMIWVIFTFPFSFNILTFKNLKIEITTEITIALNFMINYFLYRSRRTFIWTFLSLLAAIVWVLETIPSKKIQKFFKEKHFFWQNRPRICRNASVSALYIYENMVKIGLVDTLHTELS